jgi:hypothetical protein
MWHNALSLLELISGHNFDAGGPFPTNLVKSIWQNRVNPMALAGCVKRTKQLVPAAAERDNNAPPEHSQSAEVLRALPHALLISNSFQRSFQPTLLGGSVSRSACGEPSKEQGHPEAPRVHWCIWTEAGVEPTEDAWYPPTGLKPARPSSGLFPPIFPPQTGRRWPRGA